MIYRIYDLFHHPIIAWRTFKNCIITGTLKDYWDWLETALISLNPIVNEAILRPINYDELVDDSEMEW